MKIFDPAASADTSGLDRIVAEATHADGQPPFSDQSLIDLASGVGHGLTVQLDADPDDAVERVELDGLAIVGRVDPAISVETTVSAEIVVRPDARRNGLGTELIEAVIREADGAAVLVWAHGSHPAARTLADRFGFWPVRELFQLRLNPIGQDPVGRDPIGQGPIAQDPIGQPDASIARLDAFRPGIDDSAWLAINAAAFAAHPEQGGLSQQDLDARMAEPWFDADDFLLAHDGAGSLIGFAWLKVVDGIGEFYAVGVDPAAQGSGLGRRLVNAGLAHLARKSVNTASLYVDGDNTAAVSLYRSVGFTDFTVDTQYSRTAD